MGRITRAMFFVALSSITIIYFQNCSEPLPELEQTHSSVTNSAESESLQAYMVPSNVLLTQASTVNVSGGTPPYAFTILGGAASVSADGIVRASSAGLVTVEVRDSQGQSLQVTVQVDVQPNGSAGGGSTPPATNCTAVPTVGTIGNPVPLPQGAIAAVVQSSDGSIKCTCESTSATTAAWRCVQAATREFSQPGLDVWIKPATGSTALIRCWGAGGSGGRNTGTQEGGGGGGGGYNEASLPFSALASSVPVTIGQGGAGRSTNGVGMSGGDSSFGSYVAGRGGRGGIVLVGGAGGSFQTTYGMGENGGAGSNSGSAYPGQSVSYGGGGGGGGASSLIVLGGTSVHGGQGGRGGQNSANATAGAQPGGGGGGAKSGVSGNGGNGKCIVIVN